MNKKDYNSVSVIIPNFNGKELLSKNLPKVIKAASNPVNKISEIIVVDDGSADGSVAFLKKNFSDIKIVIHKKNKGFSSAINSGVKKSKNKFIVLLNNDIYPEEKFLQAPLELISSDRKIFAISFHEEGYGWAKGEFVDGFIVHQPGSEDISPHSTFFVNAGGAIYRRDLFVEIGGMDEALFSPFYWEDVDISYRALKRGLKLYWHPDAYVSPNLSASVKKISPRKVTSIQQRNHLLFIWKNLTSERLFRQHIWGVIKRVLKHPGYFRIVVLALLKVKNVIKARRIEKKSSTVSDESLLQNI